VQVRGHSLQNLAGPGSAEELACMPSVPLHLLEELLLLSRLLNVAGMAYALQVRSLSRVAAEAQWLDVVDLCRHRSMAARSAVPTERLVAYDLLAYRHPAGPAYSAGPLV